NRFVAASSGPSGPWPRTTALWRSTRRAAREGRTATSARSTRWPRSPKPCSPPSAATRRSSRRPPGRERSSGRRWRERATLTVMERRRAVGISKLLSLALRHDPSALGIELDPNGWVAVADVLTGLAASGRPIARDELVEIVETSDKKRF